MSALGQKQTFALQNLCPLYSQERRLSQKGMSLYPRKRTCAVQQPMSAMGQEATRSALPAYDRYHHNAARRAILLFVFASTS
jgi:hypothetical protein